MIKLTVNKTSSKGIAIGKAYKYEKRIFIPDAYKLSSKDEEKAKFDSSVEKVAQDLSKLAEKNDVFEGHYQLAIDPQIKETVYSKIDTDATNAEISLKNTMDEFEQVFLSMDDDYMRQRADDVKDIYQRILAAMQNSSLADLSNLDQDSIIIAKDLAPSDTATIDYNKVIGFATELGGVTSHVSIMARNKNLPALLGVEDLMDNVKSGDTIIIDAKAGEIFINPDQQTIDKYKAKKEKQLEMQAQLEKEAPLDAVTKDGKRALVYANVGNIDDVQNAVKSYIDGIGLFRSEFLYMESNEFPSEEVQFEAYKQAVELCKGEVIIRTLDIGGDKELSYYEFEHEDNPFLGFRAIRLSLSMKDMFKTQLRAMLRASAFGNLSIMYPMIVSMQELDQANKLLQQCKHDLDNDGIAYNKDIKVGMMIETPSAVIEADSFAQKVDFFSIGTNDLTQYLLAADRGNKKISYLYDSFNPAVLHSIQHIIDVGHKHNIIVGMCGEFASDERACKLLLGMGLDEFSVSHTQVSTVKHIIRNTTLEECQEIAKKIRNANTKEEIDSILD